ncbi:hypothetical protein [Sporosarcina saromensis]|uniref:hypothetical protein n=1 Tax=Sporosarcina saromensis TaxID=359365 RepID=UPI00295F1D6F|nr:hypothetical protein [Sporosarcina saromensis]
MSLTFRPFSFGFPFHDERENGDGFMIETSVAYFQLTSESWTKHFDWMFGKMSTRMEDGYGNSRSTRRNRWLYT